MSHISNSLFGRSSGKTSLNYLITKVTSKRIMLSVFSTTSLVARTWIGQPFLNSWSRSFALIKSTPFVFFGVVGFWSDFSGLGQRGSKLVIWFSYPRVQIDTCLIDHECNIFVEEWLPSKNYLTYIHDNYTPYIVLVKIEFNWNKTSLFHV